MGPKLGGQHGPTRPRLRLQKIKLQGASAFPPQPKIAFKSGAASPQPQMAFGPGAVPGGATDPSEV